MCDLYNTSIAEIQYNNIIEYRQCILRAFHSPVDTEYDPENDYEEQYNQETETINHAIGVIYESTKNNIALCELYKTAAEKLLFSDVLDLGMTILFSYEFFPLFHKCLISYFNTPAEFTIENDYYKELRELLER